MAEPAEEKSTEKSRRSTKKDEKSSKSTLSREGSNVILQVDELLVNTQLARGAYNAEKFYGHVVLRPKEAMLVTVPVSELGTVKTVREIIEQVEKEVVDGLDAQIKLREGKKPGVTAVSEIPVPEHATADIASSPGAEEPDDF